MESSSGSGEPPASGDAPGSGSLGDGTGSAEPPSAEDYEQIKRSLKLTPKSKPKQTKVPEPAPDPVPEPAPDSVPEQAPEPVDGTFSFIIGILEKFASVRNMEANVNMDIQDFIETRYFWLPNLLQLPQELVDLEA